MTPRTLMLVVALGAIVAGAPRSSAAFDAQETFRKGAVVVSAEGGGGRQDNIDGKPAQTHLEMWNAGIRFGVIPLGVSSSGPLVGALEVGLEPFYQRYAAPVHAFYAGLGLAVRYHFLALGRVVPYVEVFASAGGTDLEIREISSTFTFLLHGGVGAAVFVTDHVALYAGYRLQHVSNGNIASPNRGLESHTGGAGVSVFFP
jgi:hypothetical protein